MSVVKPKQLIRKLVMREISLVDEGDNPSADVCIVKSRDPADRALAVINGIRGDVATGGLTMDLEARLAEIEKNLKTIEQERDDALGEVTVQKARADAAEAKVAERETEIEKLKAAKPAEGVTDVDIFKGLPPALKERFEAVEKRALTAEAAAAKVTDDRETEVAVEKARAYGIGDASEVGSLLVRIEKGKTTAEDRTKLEGLFTAAATQIEKGKLFSKIGADNGAAADEEAKLHQAALDIQKAKPAHTYQQAYSEALDANPDLYEAISKKRRERSQGA